MKTFPDIETHAVTILTPTSRGFTVTAEAHMGSHAAIIRTKHGRDEIVFMCESRAHALALANALQGRFDPYYYRQARLEAMTPEERAEYEEGERNGGDR